MKIKVLMQMLVLGILFFTATEKSKAQQTLIHYWHFNNFTLTSSTLVNPATIIPLIADSTIIKTDTAKIMYRVLPGTSSSYLSYWDNTSGDTTNSRYGTPAGNGLRPRNPWDSMQLIFIIPTNGFKNITIKYGSQKSGSGPQVENYEYSTDGGNTYISSGLSQTSYIVTSTANPMTLASVSISDPAAFNNNHLYFRIRFSSNSTPPVTGGNNRLDNVTVEGDPMPAGPPFYTIGQINTTNPSTGVADSLNGHYAIRGLVYGFNQNTAGTQFLLRDNTGGITVSHASKNFGYTVTEGDSLMITGIVNTYRGLIEFAPDTIIKIASGKIIKTPTPITQLNESGENDLVKIYNLMFYTTPSGGIWPAASTNILCHTQGQTDTIIIRVLATSALAGTALPTSSLFNVAGMVQQFSSSTAAPYAFNGYEILPRTNSDIISGLAPPDAVASIATVPDLTSLTINWAKPATYVDANMTTLVFLKPGSAITQGTPNKNAISYTANADFTQGSTPYQNDASAKCVFNSDNNSIKVTGLSQSTNYYALVYVVRNADSAYSTPTVIHATTTNNLPNPVTSLTVSGATPTSATISWTKPAGYDNAVHSTLVFVKADNVVTSGIPSNAVTSYTANTIYGSGTPYQNDAAAFCVFNNDTNKVTVTNLIQGKTYHVIVWVVRDADAMYAATPTTGSGTALPPPPVIKLIHYWHFNNLQNTFTASTVANSFRNIGIDADYSSLDTSKAKMYYRTFTGTSDAYLGYFDNVGGDTLNQRLNTVAGLGFRARNPSDSMQLMFYIPTSHYKNIKLSFACEKSSIASGQYQQNYDYSTDAGTTWKTSGLSIKLDSTIGIAYTPVYISFLPTDTMAYNNPNLIFRIKFAADPSNIFGLPSGLSGNNRFDNIAIEGDTTTVPPLPVISTGVSEAANASVDYSMYPNPSNGELSIDSRSTDTKQILIFNISGQLVAEYTGNAKEIRMNISGLNQGIYVVRVTENNAVSTKKLIRN